MAHAAPERDEPAAIERRLVDQDARAEADEARGLIGLADEDSADHERGLAKDQPIADSQTEPREQRVLHDRAVAGEQLRQGHARPGAHRAVQGIRMVDGLHLDEEGCAAGGARHADELARVRERGAGGMQTPHGLDDGGRDRARRAHFHVAAQQRLRFPRERALQVDGQAAHAHQRRDAEGDTEQHGQNVAPAGARLTRRHLQGEARHPAVTVPARPPAPPRRRRGRHAARSADRRARRAPRRA